MSERKHKEQPTNPQDPKLWLKAAREWRATYKKNPTMNIVWVLGLSKLCSRAARKLKENPEFNVIDFVCKEQSELHLLAWGEPKIVSDYVTDQLQQLVPVDEYGIQIQLTSTKGKTKWMTLTKENQQEYLNKIVPAIQKALGYETNRFKMLDLLEGMIRSGYICDRDFHKQALDIIEILKIEGGVQRA